MRPQKSRLKLRLGKMIESDATGTLAIITAGIVAAMLLHVIPA